MKCPICGQELVQSKRDPNYLLCYNCKKKFRVPQNSTDAGQSQSTQSSQYERTAQTAETGQTAQQGRVRYADTYDDQYDDDVYEQEEHLSNVPIVVLAIAIVIVLALIIYMLLL